MYLAFKNLEIISKIDQKWSESQKQVINDVFPC